MAKKRKEDLIGQNVRLIALVTGGKIKEGVGSKKQEVIELNLKTPEGSLIKLSNFVRNSESPYVQEKTQELRDILSKVENDEKVYIRKNIYINKEGDQYDWFTSQESDDDKVYHQIDGFVDILDHETMGDGDYITYSTFDNEVTKKFDEIKNTIKVIMFVKEKRADRVYLSNFGEYEKEVVVDVKDTSTIQIGTAYEVQLAFKKGAMIRGEDVKEVSDWSSNSNGGSVSFEPDKLIPIGVRITDLKTDVSGTEDDDEESPF